MGAPACVDRLAGILGGMTEPAQPDADALVDLASSWWPEYEWWRAEAHHGAFHDVLVIRGRVVARLARHPGSVDRLADEHRILSVFSARQPRWLTPRALSPVRRASRTCGGMLTSWVPGRHQTAGRWPHVAEEIFRLLQAVEAGEAFETVGGLSEPRAWCGGYRFPQIVADCLVPLLTGSGVREAAHQVVLDMLAAEQTAVPAPIHGDLGMHNILWHDTASDRHPELTISGLIDLDHAAFGDPAIDVAPLLGQFGAAALADTVSPALLHRAMLHRATLSLQIAAAADLRCDEALRDFALSNFVKRHQAGTLYDPDGTRPD
jgi:Phosphotransferase enzyme family